jgi:hypothetical protein
LLVYQVDDDDGILANFVIKERHTEDPGGIGYHGKACMPCNVMRVSVWLYGWGLTTVKHFAGLEVDRDWMEREHEHTEFRSLEFGSGYFDKLLVGWRGVPHNVSHR